MLLLFRRNSSEGLFQYQICILLSISDLYSPISDLSMSPRWQTFFSLSPTWFPSRTLKLLWRKASVESPVPGPFNQPKKMCINMKYAGWKKSELQVGPVNSWMLGNKPWNPTKRSKNLHLSPFMGSEKYCSLWKTLPMYRATRPCFGGWPKARMINKR